LDIVDLVNGKLMIVIPVLWFLSAALKDTPFIKKWIIPWVISAVGIILCVLIVGLDIQSIMQGILCSGIALFGSFGRKGSSKE